MNSKRFWACIFLSIVFSAIGGYVESAVMLATAVLCDEISDLGKKKL